MNKKYFVLYLLPSRPDFAQTMTDEERSIMGEHVAYWMEKMNQGKVVTFGPVLDPESIYGLGIISVDDEQELNSFIDHDPAVKINKYEFFPMMATVADSLNMASS
ncbi:MAG TPA: YciI family protein [Flavitalea sp.]|nr:YciI family protein [Flavitalea sp.]